MTDVMSTASASAAPSSVVAAHPLVANVVAQTYADPNIPPQHAAYVAASILGALAQYEPSILALSRASPQTAAAVGLGTGLLAAIIGAFFPHPNYSQQ